jgi:hypothetical protein
MPTSAYKTVTGQSPKNCIFFDVDLMDFGRNLGFEGDLAISKEEYALNLIFKENKPDVNVGGNNSEFYFESYNLDEFYNGLKGAVKLNSFYKRTNVGSEVF